LSVGVTLHDCQVKVDAKDAPEAPGAYVRGPRTVPTGIAAILDPLKVRSLSCPALRHSLEKRAPLGLFSRMQEILAVKSECTW
jgi:hypothetical protein